MVINKDGIPIEQGVSVVKSRLEKILLEQKNVIIGIAGSSGSGKSYFSERLADAVRGKCISLDIYYRENTVKMAKEMGNNFDHPKLIDFDLVEGLLRDIKEGKSAMVPYPHEGDGPRKREFFQPNRVTIIEGLYALSDKLLKVGAYDLTISIDGPGYLNLLRRVVRESNHLNNDFTNSLQIIANSTVPMYKRYVEPTLEYCDIKLVNNYNPLEDFESSFSLKFNYDDIKYAGEMALKRLNHSKKAIKRMVYSANDNPAKNDFLEFNAADGKAEINFISYKDEGFNERKVYSVNAGLKSFFDIERTGGYSLIGIADVDSEVYLDKDAVVMIDKINGVGSFISIYSNRKESVESEASKLGLDISRVIKRPYPGIQ